MKIYINLLALCAFNCSVWGATAFFAEAPKKTHSPLFSYMGNMGGNDPTAVRRAAPADQGVTTANTVKKPASYNQVSGRSKQPAGRTNEPASVKNVEAVRPVTVQGSSLRTWSFSDYTIDRVNVFLRTEGRPLNADIDLWAGPDNTPQKVRIYIEDGSIRPFNAVIETPRAMNSVAIRNTSPLEFPLAASVDADRSIGSVGERLTQLTEPRIIQGGAVKTFPFAPDIERIQLLLQSDGRPLNARIELLQGPNNNKQVMEVYTEDGMERPFFAEIETPGVGNVVRIINTATVEFPISVSVTPGSVETYGQETRGGYASPYSMPPRW